MAHTYDELQSMTVAQLKELAKGLDHEALKGYSKMTKDVLFPAVCTALGVEASADKAEAPADKKAVKVEKAEKVVAVDKASIKKKIRELKVKRGEALAAKKPAELKAIRKRIKSMKRRLKTAAK